MKILIKTGKKLLVAVVLIGVLIVLAGAASVWYVLRPFNTGINYLKGENVHITARDGTDLVGNKRYAEKKTDKWVLLVHSYRSHKSAMSIYEKHYREKGFNTVCVDNRGHGESGGRYMGMGYLDSFDIECWIEYILNEEPDAKIVLHGLSMGAAACMIYGGNENVPGNVKAIVEDSGYYSADSYLSFKLKKVFHLPKFPIINIANVSARIAAGYFLTDASSYAAVGKSNIPILFIHCENDMTVPVDDVYKLYENAACEKDIFVAKNAGHGEAVLKYEKEYWENVDSFIERVIENED